MSAADDWGTDLPSASDDGFGPSNTGFDDFDAEGADSSRIGSGRITVDKAGWYHFRIEAAAKPETHMPNDMTKTRMPTILCTCTVLKSTNGVPTDAVHFHDIIMGGKGGGPIEGWARDQSLNFLVGLGILVHQGDKIIDPETGTTKIRSSTLVERINKVGQFIGKLVLTPATTGKNGKEYREQIEFSFGRGAFPVTAKEVAHVPCNDEALKAAGIVRAPAKPNC
jgi:hypothetical protein